MSKNFPICVDYLPEVASTDDEYSDSGVSLMFDCETDIKEGQRLEYSTGQYAPMLVFYAGNENKWRIMPTYGFGVEEINVLINAGTAKPLPVSMEKQGEHVLQLQKSGFSETLASHHLDLKLKLGVYKDNLFFNGMHIYPTWFHDTRYYVAEKYPNNTIPFTKDGLPAPSSVMFQGLDNKFEPIDSSYFEIKLLASLITVGRAIPISEDKLPIVECAEKLKKNGLYTLYKEVCYGLCQGGRCYNPITIPYHIGQLQNALK